MKKFLKKLSLLKIITFVVVIAILFSVVSKLPELQLKRTAIEEIIPVGIDKTAEYEVIPKDLEGLKEVAKNGDKTLFVDPATLNVVVVDSNGTVWTSAPTSGTLEDEDKAPLFVSFLDATGAVTTWDAYTQCIALDNTTRELEVGEELTDTYTLYHIPNGFRAVLNITQAEVTDLNQYMPKKISIPRYNECFIEKIQAFADSASETITSITGVSVTVDLENKLVEYAIPAETMEALSKEELEKVEDAQATLEDVVKYVKALDMIYDIDAETQDYYYNKYAGTPPLTVTNILIDLSKKVEYTRDDLINDSAEYGITDVEFAMPADFIIIMEVTLEDGDLVVSIPTAEIVNNEAKDEENADEEEYYTLHSISVFPNFGIVSADSYNEGFIFVPDGSGALFNINSYDSGYTEYERPIYNNTYYDTLYTDSEFNEDLMMPVFGMGKVGATKVEVPAVEEAEAAEGEATESEEPTEDVTEVAEPEVEKVEIAAGISVEPNADGSIPAIATKEDASAGVDTGFMGIIESGAETAAITVKLGSKAADASSLNKVYPTFDLMQYSNVKVFGPYSTNEAKFLARTESFGVDIKVRYKLYTEECNYYTMAVDYKNYLIETLGLEPDYSQTSPEIFLDVVSALTIEERFMGVPYDSTISMTTYTELNEILTDLDGVDTVVSYLGAYNGGIYNSLNQKANKTGANGSNKEYEELMKNHGDSIYMSTPISYVYKDNAVFNANKHGLLGYDSEPIEIYNYDIPTGRFNFAGEGHWIVNPYYLPGIVASFTKSAGNTNLAIEDLGNMVYAHNKPEDEVNTYEGDRVIANALKTLTEGDRKIVLTNPIASRMFYAEYCTDISRESSDYGLIEHNVPFRQIVMNGLTKYTTLNINESSSGKNYYLLQALELGSSPKYKITYKSVDQLKESNYNELFSTEYALFADDIKAMSKAVTDAFAVIGTTEITGHRIVAEKIFETTYATGVKVVTNYNQLSVDTEFGTLAPESAIIIATDGTVTYVACEAPEEIPVVEAEPATEDATDVAEAATETVTEGGEVVNG